MRKQYAELFAAFPTPTYATYGNVDMPPLWPEYAGPGTTVLDGERVEIGGRVFGFVGGGLRTPMRTPYEISDEEYAAKIEAVGEVDVLCTHIPPEVPELVYDTVARRFERGSRALLDAIRRTRPRYSLFGHVHQPLARRMRIGAHGVRERRALRRDRDALGPGVVSRRLGGRGERHRGRPVRCRRHAR